ncbi:acyl-CoA dehydrogenase family protein [Saccharopolyspora sp. NPDC050642]|uniref:acyl-CoA dehydrogenase family protein n=1 Tax=Saccharopolyspora sp. NPDC050642 TaxID=3157099 RepID=UPI003405CEB6
MSLAETAEQKQLRDWLRRLLHDHAPTSATLAVMETDAAHDRQLWKLMASQLGLQAMLVPEQYGGAESGVADIAVVMEELGRVALPSPFLPSAVLATRLLVDGATDAAQARLLPGLASGESIACVVLPGDITATRHGDQWRLNGRSRPVICGDVADIVLVVASVPGGHALFEVRTGANGLSRQRLPSLDLTRTLADLHFAAVPANHISELGDVTAAAESALDIALIALGAEQVGGARHCLDRAVEYAAMRTQFGRPIGSFQAVKHACANMLALVEPARSAVLFAAHAADAADPELPALASVVKAHCPEVYLQAAAETIQLHGAIGFSWEHEAHLHLKRAKSGQLLFGDARHHRERMLSLALDRWS